MVKLFADAYILQGNFTVMLAFYLFCFVQIKCTGTIRSRYKYSFNNLFLQHTYSRDIIEPSNAAQNVRIENVRKKKV